MMVLTRRQLPLLALPGGAAHAAVPGWTFIGVPGQTDARFEAAADGAIRMTADSAIGFLLRPLLESEVPTGAYRLAWRWKVNRAPPPSDLTSTSADDRPAAVHLLFGTAGGPGLFNAMRRGVRGFVLGAAFSGRALTYVWGGRMPGGTLLPNPHLPDDGILLIRRGPEARLGEWQEEEVTPAGDYQRAFGSLAPRPTYIALSVDTDDVGGLAETEIVPPRFLLA
jgi:hypothetical protein